MTNETNSMFGRILYSQASYLEKIIGGNKKFIVQSLAKDHISKEQYLALYEYLEKLLEAVTELTEDYEQHGRTS